MYKHGAGSNWRIVQQPYSANIRYEEHLQKGWSAHLKMKWAAKRSPVVPLLTEEDPPGAEHSTCKDKDGPHNDDDDERLPNRSIEGTQGSSRPIHPVVERS